MCCFSGEVSVSQTHIFARDAGDGRQYLAYAMRLKNAADVAMVLPLPVAAGSGEDAVRFIDLSTHHRLFVILRNCFDWAGLELAGAEGEDGEVKPKPLHVHQVGAFEASYVPRVADFDRLDARFRLPAGLWETLPAYRAFGFAVFKLKPGDGRVHPMGFSFPRADPSALFFPTVHIHDGKVHEKADFDHLLYAQVDGRPVREGRWFESERLPVQVAKVENLPAMLDDRQHVHLRQLSGQHPNQDIVLPLG